MKKISSLFLVVMMLFGACSSEKAQEEQSLDKLESTEQRDAPAEVSFDCAYCGMPSDEFPKWNVSLHSEKGAQWFCSPRCMFLMVKNEKTAPREIDSIKVVDYFTTQSIDGRSAFYVSGADILGPMGADLVPHQDKASAEDFLKDHQGKGIHRFGEVDYALIAEITGKNK